MKKKLQVFVSSTFIDLKDERQAAVSAILKLGHIPAGMELFTANDKSQWETIEKWIDESDVYMLILGGRYGSIDHVTGISYTEKEFNYAIKKKKPLFSIVINEQALKYKIQKQGTEVTELEYPKELKTFRAKVHKKMISFYDDVKDIQLAIMASLPQIADRDDVSGWISGAEVPDTKSLISEISTLIVENEKLKRENAKLSVAKGKEVNDESEFDEISEVLSKIDITIPDAITNKGDMNITLLGVISLHWDMLIFGVTNKGDSSEWEFFIFEHICPQLHIYGIVINEKVQKVDWTRFVLTNKGQKFIAYLNKKKLK
ncbi:hypothetical protein Rahaq_0590 [Rahnella aceris]|uniref:DUF4062 domain-containing protein n=1 Tax=Rahnella sp. (strain Y9602) TaxID=2703885 RepID=A0A0H3F5Y1_RAHSY|nr:DUF4062 domain-containing protein [Rahnella aceris]ADW72217.1 hypothetical protein Rahaq_0590 [Rahnella aceris]